MFRSLLNPDLRRSEPLTWARYENHLGEALSVAGKREDDTALLLGAVGHYRAALEERRRDVVPLDWVTTQKNLGDALAAIGRREDGTARLEEAAAAYTDSLPVAETVAPPSVIREVSAGRDAVRAEIARRQAAAP
jgi:hypothetical protein